MKNTNLSNLQNKELEEVLNNFGLHKKEQEVYLTLLSNGTSTITPLARTLNYPATTVQSILSRLQATGLVSVSQKKSRHIYEAMEPKVFKKILEEKTREISAIIPLLELIKTEKSDGRAKIKVLYRERMADIFHDALNAKSKLIYEIVAAREIQDILGEKFHFTKRRLEKNIRLKSLRVESAEIKKYSKDKHIRELREALFLPRELSFRANILFWDNSVAFFSTKSEGLAWVVESSTIREMMSQIFELLWSVSRGMET
jgi:prepilin-type processing-associated H-X9-DG protein